MKMRLSMFAALICGIFFLAGCPGGATTGGNNSTTANTPKNTATTTTNTTTTTTNTITTTEPPKTETADSVGVPECDEYIKKYEACLTKIAKDAPQVQPTLKTSFEQQRNAIKQSVSTPQGKTMMATQCKQFIESAKQSTSAYSCSW